MPDGRRRRRSARPARAHHSGRGGSVHGSPWARPEPSDAPSVAGDDRLPWHDGGVEPRIPHDPAAGWAHAHYATGIESGRLARGPGMLELARTQELLGRHLPLAPARVADIGAGPGVYSLWLAGAGYDVVARDLAPRHVDELRSAAAVAGVHVDVAVGDARALDLPDDSCDAVLLLGPLYHLI